MILRDMLSAGIALYDEYPEMYRLAADRIFQRFVPVRNWWYPGHAFHQGSAYAETRFSSDMYPLWIFDRLGAGNIFHPAQQFVPYQWIYMRRPDGQLLRAGDGQSRPPKLRSLLCASYYGDGYVLSDYLKNPGIDPMSKLFEFLWRDPDLKPLPISDLPLSRYMGFPYGWMVARTGWGEDSVIAEMKVNIYNFGNHQHNDGGSFQIYYKGPLAIDSGLYEGTTGAYGSPHHLNYYKRTIAHNSLLIYDPQEKFTAGPGREYRNDGGQRLPNNWREPRTLEMLLLPGVYKTGQVLGYGFGPDPQRPEYTYLKGDLTEAYTAKVSQVRRSFVFLNLGGGAVPAALIVFDRVVSANPAFKKYWLLHSMEEPALHGNRVTVSLSQRGWTGQLVNTTLLPQAGNTEIAKVGGPGREFWVFGENFPNEVKRGNPNDYEIGAWRVELSPKEPAAEDLFLNVMQALERGRGQALAVDRIDSSEMVGVRLAERAVLFSHTSDRTDRPLAFRLRGSGPLKCLVSDLAEGNWQVWRDGRIVHPAVPVSGDAGTLYFDGPAGDYSLRR
jgi:heparin/heparan-sulfate lyase